MVTLSCSYSKGGGGNNKVKGPWRVYGKRWVSGAGPGKVRIGGGDCIWGPCAAFSPPALRLV